MSDYMKERIFDPIGIENLSWDVRGGSGFIGPHTNAHTGIYVSARELALLVILCCTEEFGTDSGSFLNGGST